MLLIRLQKCREPRGQAEGARSEPRTCWSSSVCGPVCSLRTVGSADRGGWWREWVCPTQREQHLQGPRGGRARNQTGPTGGGKTRLEVWTPCPYGWLYCGALPTGLSTVTLGPFPFVFTQMKGHSTGLSGELTFSGPTTAVTSSSLTANAPAPPLPTRRVIEEFVQRLPDLCPTPS